MGLLSRLLLSFRPATLNDPEFGRLRYMRVGRDPAKSYWEAEWLFPPTGTRVSIGLPGTKEGPLLESRAFFLALIPEFERIMTRARPVLDQVFSEWLGRSLSVDLWSDVTLAGFGVEDPRTTPLEWDVSFETTGPKWLGISIPFVGQQPQEAVVDT